MQKQNGKQKKRKKGVSRRNFIKTTATAGTATIAGIAGVKTLNGRQQTVSADFTLSDPGFAPQVQEVEREQTTPKVNRQAILFAIGDTLIPSAPGDPGYRDLEWYGITEEVNRRLELPDGDLDLLNRLSAGPLGKNFTELSEAKRADYFSLISKTAGFKDEEGQKKLKEIYSHAREIIFTVYYQNFPEAHWPCDANRMPLLRPGDEHQITNPSTTAIVTGWDVTGYSGPLTWEEEQRRRNYFKKLRWQE